MGCGIFLDVLNSLDVYVEDAYFVLGLDVFYGGYAWIFGGGFEVTSFVCFVMTFFVAFLSCVLCVVCCALFVVLLLDFE